MKKVRLLLMFFMLLMTPISVMATEAKIIAIYTGKEGDSVLIESHDEYLLVDVGYGSNAAIFMNNYFTNKYGSNYGDKIKLSVMITHFHKDHVGDIADGSNSFWTNAEIVKALKRGKIYLPDTAHLANYYDYNGAWYIPYSYAKILRNAKNKGLTYSNIVHVWPTACSKPSLTKKYYDGNNVEKGTLYNAVGDDSSYTEMELYDYANYTCENYFEFGDVKVNVIGPVNATCTSNCGHEYDQAIYNGSRWGHYLNDYSLVTMFTIGNIKYLSAGDIESTTEVKAKLAANNQPYNTIGTYQEEKLVNAKCDSLSADILKLNHHGLPTSNSKSFMNCVRPKFVFFTKDNEDATTHAVQVASEINQIVSDWQYRVNLYSTLDSAEGGNGSFAFNIKDNSITVDKVNLGSGNSFNSSSNFKDVILNYVDSSTNESVGTSLASFTNFTTTYSEQSNENYANALGKYYYLSDFIRVPNGYIYDFQGNDSIATKGTLSSTSNVNVYVRKSNYGVDHDNNTISGITAGSVGSTVFSGINFSAASKATFYHNAVPIPRNERLRTGDILQYTLNKNDNLYALAIKGDVLGNGYLTKNGAKAIATHIIDNNISDSTTLLAADYDNNGSIKMNDVLKLLNDVKTGWVTSGSKTYYYDNEGVMKTGWLELSDEPVSTHNGKFYFNKNGIMLKSWNVIDGYMYYFDENGILQYELDGYSFNASGQLIADSGWLELNNNKYYSTGNNKFVVYITVDSDNNGWKKIGDNYYYFDDTGKMQTGWQLLLDKYDNKYYQNWYYFTDEGVMLTGWQQLSGSWYYFSSGGKMQIGWQKVGDYWYYLYGSGKMATGWQQIDYDWYYFFSGGTMATEWEEIDDKWYYFGTNGKMYYSKCETINSTNYCFNSSGACTNC